MFVVLITLSILFPEIFCDSSSSSSSSSSESSEDNIVTFTGQVFCDNRCKLYLNGELIWSKEANFPNPVEIFTFNASSSGQRIFALEMIDNSETIESGGFFVFNPPPFMPPGVTKYTCSGDGAVRMFIENNECSEELILTNDDWKCQTGIKAPEIDDCFTQQQIENEFFFDGTPIIDFLGNGDTVSFDNDCIANTDTNGCQQTVIYDGSNLEWIQYDFDDSSWVKASEYGQFEIIFPDGRERLVYNSSICDTDASFYCFYNDNDWKGAKVIWSNQPEKDNIVYCRFKYEADECD